MIIRALITCELCGEDHGTVELGPKQCAELGTTKKISTFLGDVSVIFVRQAVEHKRSCPGRAS
jgi:hypothetical protein